MPTSTKTVITDAATVPIPQFFNVTADAYQAIEGANGGANMNVINFPATQNVAIQGTPSVNAVSSTQLKGAVQNIPTAGNRVQLPNYACKEVTVIAKKGNTGSIFIGGNDVSISVFGVQLMANESFTFAISNTNLLYIDTTVSGEGISYVAT